MSINLHMEKKNEKTLLEWAFEYARLGWCVIPIRPGSKQPALRSWKPFQVKRPDEKLLLKWFGSGKKNIAVVLGPVSGDLACRDFDSMAEYEKWAACYPDLASKLPTVRTASGYHVYFQACIEGIKHIDNGELRGKGGCCLLPPSIHPDGAAYRWVNPLTNGNLLAIEPEKAGFIADVTEQSEQIEQSNAIMKKVYIVKINDSLEEIIKKTLPKKERTRNHQVWELIRTLKGDARFADANPIQLRPIIELWYKEALPYIRTTDFDETWTDFLYGWERVILPKGDDPMGKIFEKAKNAPQPEVANRFTKSKVRLLISWCRELQLAAGRHTFYLSARTAARYLQVRPMTAWRYLFLLVQENVLKEVEKGKMTAKGPRATRYRYIAN